MATIKVSSDDGVHTRVEIDGKPVTEHAEIRITLGTGVIRTFTIDEPGGHGGAHRTIRQFVLASYTLEGETTT